MKTKILTAETMKKILAKHYKVKPENVILMFDVPGGGDWSSCRITADFEMSSQFSAVIEGSK